ncbi:conserved exported hypothetical protein [Thiomonas sp. X19]|uniref:LEA type 2 family protein n=1 Tax=Thiomonas sp. X19 TaxID=1050370 RepID=UPI000B72E863|nr:LEA type 2 family protein [Thiomonas sp. X19]SCC91346.1 conserved exported hypothetical protein [Thiomonas sp. X19]
MLERRRACCKLAACTVLGAWLGVPAALAQTAPEVSIASVNGIDFQGQTAVLDLTLSIRNTAGLALPLQALRFHCGFNGIDVAQGQSTTPVNIPAGGRAMVPVRLDVDSASLLGVLANLPPDGQVNYQLQGHAEIGLTMLQIPFSHQGVIALR